MEGGAEGSPPTTARGEARGTFGAERRRDRASKREMTLREFRAEYGDDGDGDALWDIAPPAPPRVVSPPPSPPAPRVGPPAVGGLPPELQPLRRLLPRLSVTSADGAEGYARRVWHHLHRGRPPALRPSAVSSKQSGDGPPSNPLRHMLCGGSTQTGKTPFIAVGAVVCKAARVASVVLTSTRRGRADLAGKLRRLLELVADETRPRVEAVDSARPAALADCIHNGGVVVASDSFQQIEKVVAAIEQARGRAPAVRFCLFVDEADMFGRTEERRLEVEKSLYYLLGAEEFQHRFKVGSVVARSDGRAWSSRSDQQPCAEGRRWGVDAGARAVVTRVYTRPGTGRDFVDANGYFDLRDTEKEDSYVKVAAKGWCFAEGSATSWFRGPALCVKVTATAIPVILEMLRHGDELEGEDVYHTHPDGNYVGVKDFQPMIGRDGRQVFLDPHELKDRNKMISDRVEAFFEDAAAAAARARDPMFQRRGVLVLDITCPFVVAESKTTSYAHAWRIHERFPRFAMIVVTGEKISYLPPDAGPGTTFGDSVHTSVGSAIEMVDSQHGLGTPLAVFGYSQMQRGISFRSARRVPTHVLPALGEEQSWEKIVQAAGRATFAGKDVLKANGFDRVTILSTKSDYNALQRYGQWFHTTIDKLRHNDLFDALHSQYPEEFRFFPRPGFRSRRPLGYKQQNLELPCKFATPQPSPDGKAQRARRRRRPKTREAEHCDSDEDDDIAAIDVGCDPSEGDDRPDGELSEMGTPVRGRGGLALGRVGGCVCGEEDDAEEGSDGPGPDAEGGGGDGYESGSAADDGAAADAVGATDDDATSLYNDDDDAAPSPAGGDAGAGPVAAAAEDDAAQPPPTKRPRTV